MSQWHRVAPALSSVAFQNDLTGFASPQGSTLIQYVDDILVCSPTEEACTEGTNDLLKFLAGEDHKSSKDILQLQKQLVKYLGHEISQNQNSIGKEQLEAILKIPKPQTKKQLV